MTGRRPLPRGFSFTPTQSRTNAAPIPRANARNSSRVRAKKAGRVMAIKSVTVPSER